MHFSLSKEAKIYILMTAQQNSGSLKVFKNYVFCDVSLKNVNDKALHFLLVKNMGKDFSCTKI